jgi:hypothetical protein
MKQTTKDKAVELINKFNIPSFQKTPFDPHKLKLLNKKSE